MCTENESKMYRYKYAGIYLVWGGGGGVGDQECIQLKVML